MLLKIFIIDFLNSAVVAFKEFNKIFYRLNRTREEKGNEYFTEASIEQYFIAYKRI